MNSLDNHPEYILYEGVKEQGPGDFCLVQQRLMIVNGQLIKAVDPTYFDLGVTDLAAAKDLCLFSNHGEYVKLLRRMDFLEAAVGSDPSNAIWKKELSTARAIQVIFDEWFTRNGYEIPIKEHFLEEHSGITNSPHPIDWKGTLKELASKALLDVKFHKYASMAVAARKYASRFTTGGKPIKENSLLTTMKELNRLAVRIGKS